MKLIDTLVAQAPEMAQLRRDIHAHPELGFEEHRTSKIVADLLREWGIEVTEGIVYAT